MPGRRLIVGLGLLEHSAVSNAVWCPNATSFSTTDALQPDLTELVDRRLAPEIQNRRVNALCGWSLPRRWEVGANCRIESKRRADVLNWKAYRVAAARPKVMKRTRGRKVAGENPSLRVDGSNSNGPVGSVYAYDDF